MCQCEEAYVLLQIRAQSITDSPEILNTHGIAKPALPHVTYEMHFFPSLCCHFYLCAFFHSTIIIIVMLKTI